MEKEENLNQESTTADTSNEINQGDNQSADEQEKNKEKEVEEKAELSPEDKIKE